MATFCGHAVKPAGLIAGDIRLFVAEFGLPANGLQLVVRYYPRVLEVRGQSWVGRRSETAASIGDRRDHDSRDTNWGFGQSTKRSHLCRTKPTIGRHVEHTLVFTNDQGLERRGEIFGVEKLQRSIPLRASKGR